MVESVTTGGPTDGGAPSAHLPEFSRPPLVEVAIGLTFEPLPINSLAFGKLYERWRRDYPEYQEHPAIPSSFAVPGLILETGLPHVRVWFLNDSGRLIQIQRDRLIVNWRKASGSLTYPRYDALRSELETRFAEFCDVIGEWGYRAITPNSVEVTYVNQIPLSGPLTSLADVVSLLQPAPGRLGKVVESSLQVRLDAGEAAGRDSTILTINAQRNPVEEQPTAVLQLSCVSPAKDADDAFLALDRVHRQAVESFYEITTSTAHEEWGMPR